MLKGVAVKVKSIWTVGDVFIREPYSKTLDQFIPGELFEEFFCECGRRGMFTKSQVLKHLTKDHGLSIAEAEEAWMSTEEDWTAINAKTLFVKKNASVPADLEGCRICSWEEWEAEQERNLEKKGESQGE